MKNMKILLALGIVTLSCTALMVGCGGDDSVAPTPDSGKPDVVIPGTDGGGTDAPISETGADTSLPLGQIDRMGRPAINTALNDKTLKDPWNQAATYSFSPLGSGGTMFDTSFDQHLKLFNSLGPPVPSFKWTDGGAAEHPLVQPLKFDVIIVNPNALYDANGFLRIEDAVLGVNAGPAGGGSSSGGRPLNEDVVDKVFSYLVIKQFQGVCDGVNQATKPATLVWPYMAAPN